MSKKYSFAGDPQQTAVGTFTNDQWLYDHRGPLPVLRAGVKYGMIGHAAGYSYGHKLSWMDHLDTNKLGIRQWEYIAEPYSTVEHVLETYADQWEFLRSMGWKVEVSGTENSVWAALHGNNTIHISLRKEDPEVLDEIEARYDAEIEALKEEKKLYKGRNNLREGTDREQWDVIQDLAKAKELRKLIRKP